MGGGRGGGEGGAVCSQLARAAHSAAASRRRPGLARGTEPATAAGPGTDHFKVNARVAYNDKRIPAAARSAAQPHQHYLVMGRVEEARVVGPAAGAGAAVEEQRGRASGVAVDWGRGKGKDEGVRGLYRGCTGDRSVQTPLLRCHTARSGGGGRRRAPPRTLPAAVRPSAALRSRSLS